MIGMVIGQLNGQAQTAVTKEFFKSDLKELTPKTCKYFVNGNCSYRCPNAALESACNRWDLDPSDFGMEYIDCKDCNMNEKNCTCEDDCYVKDNHDYCPKAKKGIRL